MVDFIEVLININMLFFSFSLIQIFYRLCNEPYLFDKRIYFLNSIFNKKKTISTKAEKKGIWVNIVFFIVTILFVIFMVTYFTIFYNFVIRNFDDRFWYVFRLVCTPFIFILLPYFLPNILKNLIIGFFPNDIGEIDRYKIKLKKLDFILNWIYVIEIILLLTLFTSWEVNIIWLSLLIILLVLFFIIFRIISLKKLKIF